MKSLTWIFVLTLPLLIASQEEKEKWQRVYTSESLIIEIEMLKVTFGSTYTGRVRFRTIYAKPQVLHDVELLKYKSRVETIEFKCAKNESGVIKRYPPPTIEYRLYEESLLDEKGKIVKSYEWSPSDWREIKFGSMMAKLSGPACKLIDEKRRNLEHSSFY